MKDKRFSHIKATPLDLPDFASEAEEADWWFTHRDEVDGFLARARKAGAVTRGVVVKALASTQTTIRLPDTDLERAKAIAGAKGLRYQTYLKMLIHEALEREGKAS